MTNVQLKTYRELIYRKVLPLFALSFAFLSVALYAASPTGTFPDNTGQFAAGKQGPPGQKAAPLDTVTHGPFTLRMPYPAEQNAYEVPSFDPTLGLLVQAEIECSLTRHASAEDVQHEGPTGHWAFRAWSIIIFDMDLEDNLNDRDALAEFAIMGFAQAPTGTTEYMPLDAWATSSALISGSLDMWLDPSGSTFIEVAEASANTIIAGGNGSASFRETFHEGLFWVTYHYDPTQSASPVAPKVIDPGLPPDPSSLMNLETSLFVKIPRGEGVFTSSSDFTTTQKPVTKHP